MGCSYKEEERIVCPSEEVTGWRAFWPDSQDESDEEPVAVKVGRPSLANERLITVAVKMPLSMVAAMDQRTANRSDFVRKAVDERLKSEQW